MPDRAADTAPTLGASPGAAATTPAVASRLPGVGTTIFTVMSALAARTGAVNLGQGFPDFDCDPALVGAVSAAMAEGHNQYPPMAGVAALREAIAGKVAALYGARPDPDTEVTVTAGATQALLTAMLAIVHPGDEVVVPEPCYDCYAPNIAMAGGTMVPVQMTEDFRLPWDAIGAAVTPRTRALLLNSPHNPSGTVLGADDIDALRALVAAHPKLLIVSDEVYEHMVYDGVPHRSISCHPDLAARAFVISSFGKSFHVTGWKVGYCIAPPTLTAEFRKAHQFVVFTVNTPAQVGIARYLADPAPYLTLPAFYQAKRDRFLAGLSRTRLRPLRCEGSYFQVVDYSAISDATEAEFARWLATEIGVAAIPMTAFYSRPRERRLARFCFAKHDRTLDAAIDRLSRL
ncbi:MAG: methionine aminotransferase [Lautropia sp.]